MNRLFNRVIQTTIRNDINHDKGDKRRHELGGRTLREQRTQHQNNIIYAWKGRWNNSFDRKAGLTKGKGKKGYFDTKSIDSMTLMTKNRTNKNRGKRKHGDDKFEIKMQDSLIGSHNPAVAAN